jgi:serine-type D-Ala-D-Ala carboxypeptidase
VSLAVGTSICGVATLARVPSAIHDADCSLLKCIVPSLPTTLVDDFANQGVRFKSAFSILGQAIADRAFPGAVLAVTHNSRLIALHGSGRFTYDTTSPAISADTIFDVASVTKVLATTAMAMILYERGFLDLDAPVASVVSEFAPAALSDPRRARVSIRMLLAHSSGLPGYEQLFLKARTRGALLDAVLTTPLTAPPGQRVEYSDLGFILLGLALERIANESLDRFCQRDIFGPLGMTHTGFNPPAEIRPQIPPTADDKTFRHRIIQGEVNDENASVMEGIAPHAGIFSNARDVAWFAQAMLGGGQPIVRPATISLFAQRQDEPANTSRALGWDTPSAPSQSGKLFSAQSFGHLGYTGTSLWIDPIRQLSITLLTNRTWPNALSRAISDIRPRVHDAIGEAL